MIIYGDWQWLVNIGNRSIDKSKWIQMVLVLVFLGSKWIKCLVLVFLGSSWSSCSVRVEVLRHCGLRVGWTLQGHSHSNLWHPQKLDAKHTLPSQDPIFQCCHGEVQQTMDAMLLQKWHFDLQSIPFVRHPSSFLWSAGCPHNAPDHAPAERSHLAQRKVHQDDLHVQIRTKKWRARQ